MYLFEGYKRDNKNEKFLQVVNHLENQWHDGDHHNPCTIGTKSCNSISSYVTQQGLETTKDQDPSQGNNTPTQTPTQPGNGNPTRAFQTQGHTCAEQIKALKECDAAWKFNMSLSQNSSAHHRNGKEHHKCSGPGHLGIKMWVRHTPGECNQTPSDTQRTNEGNLRPQASTTNGNCNNGPRQTCSGF